MTIPIAHMTPYDSNGFSITDTYSVSDSVRDSVSGSDMSMAETPSALATETEHQPSALSDELDRTANVWRDGKDGARAVRQCVASAVQTRAGCGDSHPAYQGGTAESREPSGAARNKGGTR